MTGLDEGQEVAVSGRLLTDARDPKVFYEMSLTEVGRLSEPELAVAITAIRPVETAKAAGR